MSRSSRNRPAHRTKEELKKELVRDVTFVLNEDSLADRTKRVVCWWAFSAWTELSGKHKGCCFWSEGAWEAEEPTFRLGGSLMNKKNLRHEHAVPKKVLWDKLQEFKSWPEETVRYYFDHIVGVVVTIEEARALDGQYKSEMPQDFWNEGSPDYLKTFLRYKVCHINVIEVEWKKRHGRVARVSEAAATFEPFRLLPREEQRDLF
jgi:hypothetical protein